VRLRRRYLAIPVFLIMLAALLVIRFNAANQPTPTGLSSSLSPLCRKGESLVGVYNPSRFQVLSNCQVASGVVKSVTLLYDGDRRLDVSLDSQYARLLDVGNTIHQNGLLVVQLVHQNQAEALLPTVGQHITFVGPLVYDVENQWNAIYPVWSLTVS
jgi:hypothetical protein